MENGQYELSDIQGAQEAIDSLRAGLAPETINLQDVDVHNNDVEATLALLHQFFEECATHFPENLIQLKIQSSSAYTNRAVPFPISLIVSLINRIPNQLKSLLLWNVIPQGTNLEPLAEALQQQRSLESFDCQGCPLTETNPVELATVVAACPSLKKLVFETWDSNIPQQTCLEMAISCTNNPSLGELKFLGLNTDSVGPLLDVLEAAAGPKELDILHVRLHEQHSAQLTRVLRVNNSLESLKISFSFCGTSAIGALTAGLENNSTLKTLQIDLFRVWGQESDTDLDLVLNLLEEHNFTLARLNVKVAVYADPKSKQKADRINFLLRLNREHGRSQLLRNDSTLNQLVETVSAAHSDLSVIMYYLGQKLSLWAPQFA